MHGKISSFPAHCGSKIIHNFATTSLPEPDLVIPNYTKTLFSIFINRPDQHKAYCALTKRYKILYQSPVLPNKSTGNAYFIVIFLNKKP